MTKINRAPARVAVRRAAVRRAAVPRAAAQNRAAERAHPAIVNSIFVATKKTGSLPREPEKRLHHVWSLFFIVFLRCRSDAVDVSGSRSMKSVGEGVKSHFIFITSVYSPLSTHLIISETRQIGNGCVRPALMMSAQNLSSFLAS
jgi:hypothetical protein